MVVPLVAILCDFSVGFGIEVLRFDCGDVAHVPGDMRFPDMRVFLSIFILTGGHVAHIAHDGIFFGLGVDHEVIKSIEIKILIRAV